MRRVGYLYAKIQAFDNLWCAYHKARRGKRKRPEVQAFEADRERNLHAIGDALCAHRWRPGPYSTFTVYEHKPRLIAAAPFRDRVVHHALVNVLEPVFDPGLISDLYSNRAGKGTHAGVRRAQQFSRRYRFVLHADVRRYFPSIDRGVLLDLIARRVKCRATLELIERIVMVDQPGLETGLPLGNQTSQFFANLYLSPLDHYVKESLRVRGYLRYVDDIWLFGEDKAGLWRCKRELDRFLMQRLRLTLGERTTNLYRVEDGFPCLGYQVSPQAILVRANTLLHFRRRTRALQRRYRRGEATLSEVRSSLMGAMGHFAQGDSLHLREGLLHDAVFSRAPEPRAMTRRPR